jgi:hypothetical protein
MSAPPSDAAGVGRRARIDELEQQLTDRREALDRLQAAAPPPPPDLAATTAMLGKLPILGDLLADLPHDTLRELFDSLHLRCTYHHATREVAVEPTLADRPDHSQVWSVPLTCHNTNLSPLAVGQVIHLPARHAKARRDGYRTS